MCTKSHHPAEFAEPSAKSHDSRSRWNWGQDREAVDSYMQTQSLHGGTHSTGERNQIMHKIQCKARAVERKSGIPCKMPSCKSNVLVLALEIPRKECHPTSKRDTYPFLSPSWFSHRPYCPRTLLSWSRSWRWKNSSALACTRSQSSADLLSRNSVFSWCM